MEKDLEDRLKSFSLSKEENTEILLEPTDVIKNILECEKSLIGKIFGIKKVSILGFKSTMMNIWQTKESFSIREIGCNLFQVVFVSQEDKIRVLNGKTWCFDSQYLILCEWAENVLENTEIFNTVELWIQLWNIPFHWLSIETGRKIGAKFGKLIDIVIPESGSSKGRHIKIMAQVNLEKPILRCTNIKLEEEACWVDFLYENLQTFCFYCGKIGHSERGCQSRKEDLALDKLRDGQFGEWLRAGDLGLNKTGAKVTRKPFSVEPQTQKDEGALVVNNIPPEENQKNVSLDANNETVSVGDGNLNENSHACAELQKEEGGKERKILTSQMILKPQCDKENEMEKSMRLTFVVIEALLCSIRSP
ncbi:hypothetical protein DH2020_030716 [Rehmannia glutinosa]|uniref:CCHC-type domain-containing protein n=1 Tax=Rehmannia glutinosa TaxID=99300 RepID=A0ABR0VK04_REHGL